MRAAWRLAAVPFLAFAVATGAAADRAVGSWGRSAYVEFDLPPGSVPTYIGPRNTAKIPTADANAPLSLDGLRPVFRRLWFTKEPNL